MKKIKILKNELKQQAKDLRYFKDLRNNSFRFHRKLKDVHYLWKAGDAQYEIRKRKYEFRHKHIAYCQLRGRLRDEIEKPASNNLPNEEYIQELMEEYR